MNLQRAIVNITPPFLLRIGNKSYQVIKRAFSHGSKYEHGKQQPADYYDTTFRSSAQYKKHYTESCYYPLWTVITDRIRIARIENVLDIGCGSGQLACLMRDMGIQKYVGLDFSHERIAYACKICPEYTFIEADIFNSTLLEESDYNCVVMTEFLEHVNHDIDVLKRIRSSSFVLATIPNFPSRGHVRYFRNTSDAIQRYGSLFYDFMVSNVSLTPKGDACFLFQGKKR